jgi:hypothetical protein
MKHGFAVAVVVPLLFAGGCGQSKQVKVTYMSDPPGGTLYELNGELSGPCPQVIRYDTDEEAIENGYLDVAGLMVRWPSGPEKRSGKFIRITVDGTERRVTFVQPKGEPESAAPRAGANADR